jgi:hypothetical protein
VYIEVLPASTGGTLMTGDELQLFVKSTEVIIHQEQDNIYEFPTGRPLGGDEIGELVKLEAELESWELVLSEW